MYKLEIGRKGLLEAADKEEGYDIGAGSFNAVIKAFSEDVELLSKIGPKAQIKRMEKTVLNCQGKEVEDLTDDEKFAICFFAGVEIDYQHYNEITMSYVPTTKNPVGIAKIDGKFQVYERKG